jgi:heat shock protein HslJ
VTIGPLLACTRAACSTMAFENTYVGVLAGESHVRVDGDSLTLSSSRGVLRFHR